jgi:hypothetical protein
LWRIALRRLRRLCLLIFFFRRFLIEPIRVSFLLLYALNEIRGPSPEGIRGKPSACAGESQ